MALLFIVAIWYAAQAQKNASTVPAPAAPQVTAAQVSTPAIATPPAVSTPAPAAPAAPAVSQDDWRNHQTRVGEFSPDSPPQADEKAAIKKAMTDAVLARHHGILPKNLSDGDTLAAIHAGAKWRASQAASQSVSHVAGFKMPEASPTDNGAAPPNPEAQVTPAKPAQSEFDKIAEETRVPTASPAQAKALQTLIRLSGYDCGKVDGATPYTLSRLWGGNEGFTVYCNNMRYKFEVENHGGRWVVNAP